MPYKQTGFPYGTSGYNRWHNLKKKYGITTEQWDVLFQKQGKVCAICGTDRPRGKNWHTDHNHVTDKIRGILCGWCNTALGKFQESEEIMVKAASYLKANE